MKRFRVTCALAALGLSLSMVSAAPAYANFPGKNGLLAFSADTGTVGNQVYTVRPNGHHLQQVTTGPSQATQPDWSPDGGWLAYTLDDCTVALIRPDGTGQRTIESQTPGGCEGDPVFTPDSTHLVFSRYDPVVNEEAVWIMDLNGNDRRRIATGPDGAQTPEISPDGQTVTFLSSPTPGGLTALFAVSAGGGEARQVTPTLWGITFKHDWAPDGSRLVMSDNAGDPSRPTNMLTTRPDGTGLVYLTDLQPADQDAVAGGYSPDCTWIAYRLQNGNQNALMIVHPNGKGARTVLPFSTFNPRYIDWGPASPGRDH
jgi:Tol biopolymer transport system component